MAYEVFSRNSIQRQGAPAVSFMQIGRISFNKAAAKIFQDQGAEHVVLLWDSAANKVAIRPISKTDPRAYKLNRTGREGKGSSVGFSAVTFFDHIGFDYKNGTRSFPVEWNAEQGMLEIKLVDEAEIKTPLLATIGGGGKRHTKSA
jgi:hypothetical protein